jgi:ATP-binding cassette, subfamily F, member 3
VFIFPTPDKLRPPLLRIEDGYFTYNQQDENSYILRNVNFNVDMESRIAIVGANGVGKSTLLKLLVGTLGLTSGNSYRNQRLGLSMFTQHHVDQLKLHCSPLEQFMEDFPGSSQ